MQLPVYHKYDKNKNVLGTAGQFLYFLAIDWVAPPQKKKKKKINLETYTEMWSFKHYRQNAFSG